MTYTEKLINAYAIKKKLEIIGAMTFNSPIAIKAAEITSVRRYPLRGSPFLPNSFPKISMYGNILSLHTAWNTFGALTNDARADDSVAAKIPISTRGPHKETFSKI